MCLLRTVYPVSLLTDVKTGLSGGVVRRPITLREPRIDVPGQGRYVVSLQLLEDRCVEEIRGSRTAGQMV